MSPSPRSAGSALAILAAGFAASAVLRAGEVVAALPAFAQETSAELAQPVPEALEDSARSTEPIALIADLRAQADRLDRREAELVDRAQALEAVEARIRAQLEELERAQDLLERTAVVVDDAAGRDVRHLAAMYGAMKADKAAAIFDRMTPSFAAGFLAEMEAETAAEILANMEAEAAYAVSLLLASRNLDRPGREGARATP